MDNQEITISRPAPLTGKLTTYAAKYNIQFFQRKKIPSYAPWSVYIKQGHRYPKVPQGYGAAATLEQAQIDMAEFLTSSELNMNYVRNNGLERWAFIKRLIACRDYTEINISSFCLEYTTKRLTAEVAEKKAE